MAEELRLNGDRRFDIDLAEGKLHERAFGRLLCETRFEHKWDFMWARTGNIFVEVSQLGGQPSGLATTTAEWWAVEYYPKCYCILPTRMLKEIVAQAHRAGERAVAGGDNDNRGYLIPLSRLADRGVIVRAARTMGEPPWL